MTIIIFIIVLAILIFVHELGHFIAARIFGIRVDAFAVGFGPKLFSWKWPSKKLTTVNDTEYSIRLIPFGGYVKIFGENISDETVNGPDKDRSFANKPRWQQAIVLASGVLCNFIFAWLIYTVIFSSGVASSGDMVGKYEKYASNDRIIITEVEVDSPAANAGIKIGDIIGGFKTPEEVQQVIKDSQGKNISLDISTKNNTRTLSVAPKSEDGLYKIGIAMERVSDLSLPIYLSVVEAAKYTWAMISNTVVGLYSLIISVFQGNADFSQISGPVGIAGIVGDAASLGFTFLAMITAIISINLGVINLLPFPALDGGRILVVGIESIIRRRVMPKYINIVNTVGFVLLMALMVFVTYKDIVKLIKG
jgi:regulator of sigma E protease